MTESLSTVVPETSPDPLTMFPGEALASMGDVISQALLFALGRNHLDSPIFQTGSMRVLEGELPAQPDVAFLHLEQVGQPVGDDPAELFTAIQTTLAASHDPRYGLIFIISSDGLRNHIYLGVSSKHPDAQPRLFIDQLGEFLSSNWPGTRVRSVEEYKELIDRVHVPLTNYRYARAFTGLPSPKESSRTQAYPQSIDQFMRGLRGKPYLYLVLADPMSEGEVGEIIGSCRSLSGQVHAFAKATIQRSTSEGISDTTSRSESESRTTSTTAGTSEGTTEGKSRGVLGTSLEGTKGLKKGMKGAGLAALSGALVAAGGPFLLSGMLGMFGQLLPSTSGSITSGASSSESESVAETLGTSTSEGTTSSESLSFGREYLNKHAEACETLLESTIERFGTARSEGCWNVGVYLVSDQEEAAAQGQAQLKALISGAKSAAEPVRAHDLGQVWDGQVQVSLDAFQHPRLGLFSSEDERIDHPLGRVFEGLTTPLNTRELSLLANLPLREMPGLPVQPTAYFSLNPPEPRTGDKALALGSLLEGGEHVGGLEYAIDPDTLTRHIFVTGITGSGKSNTCRRLIDELMSRKINFMVIEPAKDEYVQLALSYNQAKTFKRRIAVYMPGRKEWGGQKLDKLKLNPFDIVQLEGAQTAVMPHMDRLKSIFNASFPMQEILPVILEEALIDLYDSQGWLEEEAPPPGIERPTLEQLYNRITKLVRDKGYEQRITDNIIAALRTRIGSLLRGWKGQLFNHPISTPWAKLFDRPVVINLSQMGDDADKCFTMALLLNFMYEYRQAQHEVEGSPESAGLRHLAIFEEAHRVLRAAPAGLPGGSPQAKMGEMFADILAEIRAYGQGLGIVDQVPAKLIPDALKNTNLKIVHRLVAADDRQAMAGTLALTPEQTEVIARLKVGQAIVAGVQDDMPSWVKIHYTPLPERQG